MSAWDSKAPRASTWDQFTGCLYGAAEVFVELPLEAISPWTADGGSVAGCAGGVRESEVTS
jgi:hypothetical protein